MDFFDAGFIDTLFKISASTEKAKMRASCFALDILVWILLCITQDDFFTHICMRAFDEGGVDHFLRIIARGKFGWQGPLAMRCLHKLIMPPSCAERLTALQVSRIIQLCSKICLNGLQTTVGRSDTYNSAQYFGPYGNHWYPLRLFLNTQDLNTRVDQLVAWRSDIMHEAAEACQWCLNRRLTPISRQFSLQVLRHNPEITDNLLQIASTPRSRTDFSTNSDCLAAHTLLYLTMLPPGVIPETESQVSDEDSAELQAALKCIQILYSHPHAVTMIIGMRSKLNDEDLDMLHRCIQEAYPDKDRDVETIRASLKAISLRLLINLTYVPFASPHLFLALLPFAYTTCLRASRSGKLASIWEGVKQCSEEYLPKENDRYLLEFCRSKQEYDGDRVLVNLVSPGLVLGPLLLFRLMFKLSQAGYGVKHLQRMTALPDEMPLLEGLPTYLVHIHQVADSKVMGKLIRMSIGIRAVQERNRGKELIRDGRLQSIITAVFSSAAELTLNIIAFASHPINISTSVIRDNQKAIRQAKREAALCLGNAAEMAGRTGQWGMARSFSNNAIRVCESVSLDDGADIGWDVASTKEKNVRRLEVSSREKVEGLRYCFGLVGDNYRISEAQEATSRLGLTDNFGGYSSALYSKI